MLGMLTEKHFFLFGKPISASRSPALHNNLFQQTGLPHNYSLFETDVATDVQNLIRSDDFGGASVTIPLKLDVIEFLDELTDSAKTIGAVNTIIPSSPTSAGPARLIGDNTDWLGMVYSLKSTGAVCQAGLSALVIGSGGTSRAAVYALQSMGYSPVYITARNATNCQKLITSFPSTFPLKVATHPSDLGGTRPSVIISTVPADQNMDSGVAEVVSAALSPGTAVETATNSHESSRILLEMAYTPRHTPLMQRAEESGWTTIPGLEVLAAQGWYQVSLVEMSFSAPCHSTPWNEPYLLCYSSSVSTLDWNQANVQGCKGCCFWDLALLTPGSVYEKEKSLSTSKGRQSYSYRFLFIYLFYFCLMVAS